MLQRQGDGGPTRDPEASEWSQELARMQRGGGTAERARATQARPTPLPKVNFTLLGLGPAAGSRVRLPAPPPLGVVPPAVHEHYADEARQQLPSDAELEALLGRVDADVDATVELDARPMRPPWVRRRRRSMWAGLIVYLAVGSASFLWFAQRSRRPAPEAAPPPVAALTAQPEPAPEPDVPQDQASAVGVQSAEPARPASAAAPRVRKAERRALHKKSKAKRHAKQLAARAKRKKRAARAAQL